MGPVHFSPKALEGFIFFLLLLRLSDVGGEADVSVAQADV
jgi:hypothetical protein